MIGIDLDYIIPPSENNAVFIMTNFIQTDQRRLTCSESASLQEAFCVRDSDCQNRPFSPRINGLWTGRCILSPNTSISNSTIKSTRRPSGLCEYAGNAILPSSANWIGRHDFART